MFYKLFQTALATAIFFSFFALTNISFAESNLELINSSFDEDRPLVSADGNIMFFNSCKKKRPNELYYGYDNYNEKYRYDYDIYYSVKINGKWTEHVNISEINSKYDEGVLTISPDGNIIYFISFKDDYEFDGGPFYKAELRGNKFTNIQGLGGKISSFIIDGNWNLYETPYGYKGVKYIFGASISPDGKEFYFATDISAKYGKIDIWVSKLTPEGWSEPKNLGPVINKINAVNRDPYIALDNHTLIYSTNGINGYGGYDLYFSQKTSDGWEEPQNLGPQVNTINNDYQLTIPATGNVVYVVTYGKYDSNIESKILPKDISWLPSFSVLLGKIFDKDTKKPVEADITIYNETLRRVSYGTWNSSETGKYLLVLQLGAKYVITVQAEGYHPIIWEVDLTKELNKIQITYDFALYKVETFTDAETETGSDSYANVKVYPNPAINQIAVELLFPTGAQELAEITITNLEGRVMARKSILDFINEKIIFDISEFPLATYIVTIKKGNFQRSYKFIKMQ